MKSAERIKKKVAIVTVSRSAGVNGFIVCESTPTRAAQRWRWCATETERAAAQKVRGRTWASARLRGNQIADERKQAGEINLPISAACC